MSAETHQFDRRREERRTGDDRREHDTGPDDASVTDAADVVHDPARLALVNATRLLGEPNGVPALERAARVAARALRVPTAQVNLVTDSAQVPIAAHVDPPRTRQGAMRHVPVAASYCQLVVQSGNSLVVPDARAHAATRDIRAPIEAGVISYVGVPIYAPSGDGERRHVIGTVCVYDSSPRAWSALEVETLEDVAATVADEVAVRLDASVAIQAAERQTARLLTAAGEGILGTDERGVTTFANPAAERLLGYSAAELQGNDQHALIHHTRPDGSPYLERDCPLHAARVAGRACRVSDELFWRKDGSSFPVEYTMTPILEEDRVTGTVVTFQDVTERKRVEALERSAREAAEQANQAKSEFLAVMSHELRTPLNAIGGYAELIRMGLRGPVTEAQRTDLGRIRRSQEHLLGLINDVLNFAKLEAGHAHFDITDVTLREVIDDVGTLVTPQLTAKGLTYHRAACDPVLTVCADREKLEQVLVNMLSNAAKFTDPPGSVTVSCEAAADVVRMHVADTGIGIPASRLGEIFDPFVQVDAGLTRAREGTGLGLAISRDLARLMDGELTAVSTVGEGSTFTLTLPRGPDRARDAGEVDASALVAETLREARAALASGGVHAVLELLNSRAAHRFTGLYRFDGDTLRSVAIFDRENPSVRRGADAPLHETYCSIVSERGATVAAPDTGADPELAAHPANEKVVSYCGALVRDAKGTPVGTLCSFDVVPRPVPAEEIPMLEGVAALLGGEVG